MSRCSIIFNPNAGSADEVAAFDQAARERGDVDFCRTEQAGDGARLAEQAARDGRKLVLAAGGDGTVSEVVTGLMRAREAGVTQLPALLVVPLGTGNDLARTFDLPDYPPDVLPLIDTGERMPLDVMRWKLTGDEGEKTGWAINVIAGGFSSKLQSALTKEVKQAWGPFAYLRAGAATPEGLDPHDLSMSIDGGRPQKLLALNAIIANAKFAGGGIAVAPQANPGDGKLDLVIIAPGEDGFDLAALAACVLSGDILEHELVVNVPGKHFVLEADPPMPFNVDGDRVGAGRLEVEVIPNALTVVRPKASTVALF